MAKTAFIFPGQGSQYVGMGKDFYDSFEVSRKTIDLAGKASGIDVKELLFTENDRINITEFTQIAMLADEIAVMNAVLESGICPDVNAGLSLGEYAALVSSGVISEYDAFKVIAKRGRYMQEAVPTGGAMCAVIGLDNGTIEDVVGRISGTVSVANYNCPGQTVITGEKEAVDAAAEQLKAAGAKRCLPLNVSGPFHSSLLIPAGEKLAAELENIEIRDIQIPYVTNVTADYVTDKSQVRELLKLQISSPVRWQQSIERMIADGVDTFIEIGPKRSLCGFMRKIDKTVKALHVDTVADLEKILVGGE